MLTINGLSSFHGMVDASTVNDGGDAKSVIHRVREFYYDFENYFHPFVGAMIGQLNATSVAGMLDPQFLNRCHYTYTSSDYVPRDDNLSNPEVSVTLDPQAIDVALPGGPYAVYNWELLYHIPVMVAVYLSNNQRFAEAQKWFHLVFDPTSTGPGSPPQCFWKSFVFWGNDSVQDINQLLLLLSTPGSSVTKTNVIEGYNAIMANPFDPFVVARTRPGAFQWYVVMKYLDNLIAWGDSLFMQDTIETINEATLCYVLAANLLGPRPQAMPQPGTSTPRNFLQLKQAGLDRMSNALIDLEGQFPFNLTPPASQSGNGCDQSGALFGIGRSLYFCIPQNANLMSYWDVVADRLFKIRNSENILGVVQQLPLFDPPLDPGMLVKAAAAGIDIGSIVSGLNQPIGPERSLFLIQKSLEITGEVRSLGNALLSAIEKGNSEHLTTLRQQHEVQLQELVKNVRFLQWKHAQETTNALLKSRESAYERYAYYLHLFGQTPDGDKVPQTFTADRRELTEANFDDAYSALVTKYNKTITPEAYPKLQLAQGSSPSQASGASGSGQLYLNTSEDSELNTHLPAARDERITANVSNSIAAGLAPIPDTNVHFHYWGIGGSVKAVSGQILALVPRIAAEVASVLAAYDTDQAGIDAKTAGYQRRVDEWTLQANLAARELMSIGRQLIASLIGEQAAYHDHITVQTQVQQAKDVEAYLESKFTNEAFYKWMQSDLSALYYQYYRFACDTARKAEQTMKQELMRPELDQTQFIQYNYWDSGHRGLLSGEALYLDIKRMEMAYHDNNKRELEMTRHVSLRQLDPMALLSLRITGSCTVTLPEWLYDRDCPGHYMRRIKSVALSIPSVVGPYTGVNCTLTLQSSSVRVSPLLANGVYARNPTQEDDRFVDYFGSTDIIVTSGASNDSGMFQTNLRDERFLPFEGGGAISTWLLSLPPPSFDYSTISDVILTVFYTAREAGNPLASQATKELQATFDTAGQPGQALMFCLRYDFPTEWAAFVNGTSDFQVTIESQFFPYFAQEARKLTVDGLTLYAANGNKLASVTPTVALSAFQPFLGSATLTLPPDPNVLVRTQDQQVFMVLTYHFGAN